MTRITTLNIGKSIQAITVNPETNLVYAVDTAANQLILLDGHAQYQVKSRADVGVTPDAIALNLTSNLIYLLCQNLTTNLSPAAEQGPLAYIQVLDGQTLQILDTINFTQHIPVQLALNPSTGALYTAGDSLCKLVDNRVVQRVPLSGAYGLATNPDNNQVYVVYLGPRFQFFLARFNGEDLSFIDQTPIKPNGNGVAVNLRMNQIYTSSIGPYNLVQIWQPESSPPSLINEVNVGGYPQHIAVNENLNRYYTNNYFDSTVSIIDAESNLPVGEPIQVGPSPYNITVDPIRNRVFTANFNGSISLFEDDIPPG